MARIATVPTVLEMLVVAREVVGLVIIAGMEVLLPTTATAVSAWVVFNRMPNLRFLQLLRIPHLDHGPISQRRARD